MAGHAAMLPFERLAAHNSDRIAPPVFIIGAPRSGTSLLYELMITRFRFAYTANAAHRFYKTPVTATRLFKSAITGWQGDFTSNYGHINGWGAPSEGGWIWQRWLQDGDWTDGADFPDDAVDELRNLTHGLSAALDAPFLNKNVMHSNRLRLMHRIWPDALYIEVKRDILDNARSIIRAERSEGGPEKAQDIWWSVRPKLARDYAGKTDIERAIAQLIGVNRDIAEDIKAIAPGRLHNVDYTALCADPKGALHSIKGFLTDHDCHVDERTDVPASFPIRPSQLLGDADEALLAGSLETLSQSATLSMNAQG